MRECNYFCDRCKFPTKSDYDLRTMKIEIKDSEDFDYRSYLKYQEYDLCVYCRELLELFIRGYTIDKMVNIHEK